MHESVEEEGPGGSTAKSKMNAIEGFQRRARTLPTASEEALDFLELFILENYEELLRGTDDSREPEQPTEPTQESMPQGDRTFYPDLDFSARHKDRHQLSEFTQHITGRDYSHFETGQAEKSLAKQGMQKYQRGLAFAKNGIPVIAKQATKPEAPAWVRLDTPIDEAEKQHLLHHAKHAAYHA